MRLHAETPPSVPAPFDALRGYVNGRASAELLASISRHLEPCVADLTVPSEFATGGSLALAPRASRHRPSISASSRIRRCSGPTTGTA